MKFSVEKVCLKGLLKTSQIMQWEEWILNSISYLQNKDVNSIVKQCLQKLIEPPTVVKLVCTPI